jgi:hypothetical protein
MITANTPQPKKLSKAHPARFFLTAAAIDQLPEATIASIADLTGLQRSKIAFYIDQLVSDYEMSIKKAGYTFRIVHWGRLLNAKGVRAYLQDYLSGKVPQDLPLEPSQDE